ncbi:hypothetical protein V8C86DRAFT_3108089 [Haematococcus lacustris]
MVLIALELALVLLAAATPPDPPEASSASILTAASSHCATEHLKESQAQSEGRRAWQSSSALGAALAAVAVLAYLRHAGAAPELGGLSQLLKEHPMQLDPTASPAATEQYTASQSSPQQRSLCNSPTADDTYPHLSSPVARVSCIAAAVRQAAPAPAAAAPAAAPATPLPAMPDQPSAQQDTFLSYNELCDLAPVSGPLPESPPDGPSKPGRAAPRLQLDLLQLLGVDAVKALCQGGADGADSTPLAKLLHPRLMSLEHRSQSFPPPGYSSSNASSRPNVLYNSQTGRCLMSLKVGSWR